MDELRESAEQPLKDASQKEKVEMENAKIPVEIENDDLLEKIEEVINDKKTDAEGDANEALPAEKDYLDQLDNVERNDVKTDGGDKPTSTSNETNCDGKDSKDDEKDKNQIDTLNLKDDLSKDAPKSNNLSDGVDNCNLSNDLKDDVKCNEKSEADTANAEKEPENNGEATTDGNDGETEEAEPEKEAADVNPTEVPPTLDQPPNEKPSETTNDDTANVTNKTVEQIKENSEVDFVKPPEVLDGGGEVKEKIFGIAKEDLIVENTVKIDVVEKPSEKEETPVVVVNDVAQKEETHLNEVIKENDEKMSIDEVVENPNSDVMEVDSEEKMDVDIENELQDEEMKTIVDDVPEENPKEIREIAVVENEKEKQKEEIQNEVIEIDDKNDDEVDEEDNKGNEKEEKEIESINLDDDVDDSKDKIESKLENSDEVEKVELNKNVQNTNNLPPESKDKETVKETVKIDDDPESDDDVVEIIDDESPKEEVKESQPAKETSSSAQKKPETKEEQANESKKAISENIKNSEQEETKTQVQNETTTTTANHKVEEKAAAAAAEEAVAGEKVETKEESSQTTGPATSTKKESDASVSSSSEAIKNEKDDDKKSVEKSTEKQEKKSTEGNASEDKPKVECLDNLQFNGVHISIENCTYEVTIVSDKNGFKSLSLERHDTNSDETNKTESTEEKITKNKFVSIVGLRQFIKDFYSSVDDKSDINEPFTPAGKDGPRSGNRKRTETPKSAAAKSKSRKRSLNADDESEKRMKLSTPPPQPEPAVEVESPKILAKWVDKTFYPGKIVEQKPGNKYVVVFVDGQTKTVRKDSIIFTGDDGNLPLKDQVVHVMIDNNYEAGVVEAMEKDENNKMIYTVVTDNNTVKVPLSDICVKEDVAKTIQSRSSISLDDSESTKSPASKRKSVRNSTEPGCSGVETTKGRRRQNRYS